MWARWGVSGVFVGALLACGGWPFAPPLPLSRELDGPERDAAIELGASVVDERFPAEIVGADADAVLAACATHGPAFVWLAARDERAPVRTAALRAAAPCLPALDRADASVAARTGLRAEDPHEMAAAFVLAGALMVDEPSGTDLAREVVALVSSKDPAVRYEAFAALDRSSWGTDPDAVAAVADLLQATEPWLVTEALRLLRFRAGGVADPSLLRERCVLLLGDLDPGIRGRAALALARLVPDDPELPRLLVGLLVDDHPFTRSAASEAVGDLGYLPAAHALVANIDDQRPNTWDMLPFERLDGTMVVQHHVGSLFERVDDAFLRSLQRVTEPLGEAAFTYREVHLGKWRDLDILAAGRDARKWYEDHGASLPPPP
jgi:hypothetical protein